MKKTLLIMLGILFIGLSACEKEPMEQEMEEEEEMEEEMCVTDGVTYTGEIQTILSGCTASTCHGASSGRSMANYDDAKAYAQNGRILGALNREAGFSPMPKNGSKLEQCKIDQISAWIDAGYPES